MPTGFTIGKHTTNAGYNETGQGDSTDNEPPVAIINLLGDQAIKQSASNAYYAGGRAKDDAYPQNWHREDELCAEGLPIFKIEFHEVDREEGG